jgi:hypothetical protein
VICHSLESERRYLESDPDAINFNTAVNYATNVYHGTADLFRVGSGVGNAIYNPCSDDPLGDVLRDDIFRRKGRPGRHTRLFEDLESFQKSTLQEFGLSPISWTQSLRCRSQQALFELQRAKIADCRMSTQPVVPDFDVFKDGGPGSRSGLPAVAID